MQLFVAPINNVIKSMVYYCNIMLHWQSIKDVYNDNHEMRWLLRIPRKDDGSQGTRHITELSMRIGYDWLPLQEVKSKINPLLIHT